VTDQTPDTKLCACGSGLRRVRCCAADMTALPLADNAALLDDKANEATKFFNEKKYTEAEALALKVLDLAPNQRVALRVLYEIRKAQNAHPAAEALARRMAALPGAAQVTAQANGLLAQYLVGQGRHADALPAAGAAVRATPKDATAHHVLGVVLTETGQVQAGEWHYRRALALLGREDGLVQANLAWNLKLQGRLTEAAALYATALAAKPDNRRGVGGAAQVAFIHGEREAALARLDAALTQWPEDRTLRLLRVLGDVTLNRPQAVLDRLGEPDSLLAPELLVRGQALAQLGMRAEAVAHYGTARRLMRERGGVAYQPEPFMAQAAAYKAYFTGDRVQPLPKAGAGPFTPVFLLGFPRSGTGLLEQLLAAVPGFAAGDELSPVAELVPHIARLADTDKPYPEALDEFLVGEGAHLPGQLRAMDVQRRARAGLLRQGTHYVTDRAVSNMWHLGLIKLLYPEAPIIHVVRHPYDLMLSNLAHDRKLEANCNAGLPALARHYGLMMDMQRHYRGQLTLRYLPVRYEDLVANPEQTLRTVLDFIGTDAAVPADLAANAARMADPVPPHNATRAPVHTAAAYRHRDYLDLLPNLFAEVEETLRPWISELGYEEAAAP